MCILKLMAAENESASSLRGTAASMLLYCFISTLLRVLLHINKLIAVCLLISIPKNNGLQCRLTITILAINT